MSSSDSEDCDYYRNLVKNFEKNLNKERAKETVTTIDVAHTTTANSSLSTSYPRSLRGSRNKTQQPDDSIRSLDSIDEGTDILDEFIAKNTKKGTTRSRRNRGSASKRARISNDTVSKTANLSIDLDELITDGSANKKRKSTRTKKDFSKNTDTCTVGSLNSGTINNRGQKSKRGTGGGRSTSRGRGRSSSRGRSRTWQDSIFSFPEQWNVPTPSINTYPIYSVGNTDDYPDQSENVPLFTSKPSRDSSKDVIIMDENGSMDDEKLEVKVIWQSIDIFKFPLCKSQKLKMLFDYFSKEKNVGINNLLFTYNNKILNYDDTPNSIDYSIAKFIHGGVVNKNVMSIVDEKNRIEIKFQCSNRKNPYIVAIHINDNLLVAMEKCAEHLDLPLTKLKFEFDGDSISGNDTPKELDFEGGECIDVKMIK